MASGLILVWDLDNTLVSGYENFMEGVKGFPVLNPSALPVLKRAYDARKTGKVDSIFLLTNNSNQKYIDASIYLIEKAIKVPEETLFDDIMTCNDIRRIEHLVHNLGTKKLKVSYKYNPSKSLFDIKMLLASAVFNEPITLSSMQRLVEMAKKFNTENLKKRVYFFDDNTIHTIRAELGENYILINPPFTPETNWQKDKTNWSRIIDQLPEDGEKSKGKTLINNEILNKMATNMINSDRNNSNNNIGFNNSSSNNNSSNNNSNYNRKNMMRVRGGTRKGTRNGKGGVQRRRTVKKVKKELVRKMQHS